MNTPRFIDIHILQTLPYNNINRDDLGSPKQLVYGGVDRTRVSSQAWKRVTRLSVEQQVGEQTARTRRVPEQVAQRLEGRGWPGELAAHAGAQVLLSAGKDGLKNEKGATNVLLYLPLAALDALADLAEQHREAIEKQLGAKKPTPALPVDEVAAILKSCNGTIHLFGRMLAELPGGEVDGAVQVAHAFTTHGTEPEVDFFTAVDDLNPAEAKGSGHMNSGEFSSGVFYRYANIDIAGLAERLTDPEMTRELTSAFLTAFAASMPTGKQHATAAQSLPDLVHVSVRSDRPVSLAAAFEAPVRAEADGWAAPSQSALSSYASRLHRFWGTDGLVWSGYASVSDKPLDGMGTAADSFGSLVTQALGAAFEGRS
ncbi:type I-E CRISPR-associated protein Cas7/Cse4/CasC [Nocardia tengchongensis]|uniref:type I-E CRISPR-associated protein Cas7/Cse4/CasC n=1 Tax=Nocardia tengchongensis TaxID=2055889 RepID=UPI00368168A8